MWLTILLSLCAAAQDVLYWQVYYHNTVSGESSWQKPEGFEGEAVSAGGVPIPVSTEDIPMTGWAEVTCSDGRKYFYHADRQVSLYNLVHWSLKSSSRLLAATCNQRFA